MPFRRAQFRLLGDCSRDEVQSLPDLVRFNAQHNGDYLFSSQEKAKGGGNNFIHVTYRDLAVAIERCSARLLADLHGVHVARIDEDGNTQKSEPVALFLESGLLLFVHLVALLSIRVPVAVLSARLSVAAVRHIIQRTGVRTIITSQRLRKVVTDAAQNVASNPPKVHIAPHLDTFLTDTGSRGFSNEDRTSSTPAFPEDDCDALILHSSGTTGLPKPIYLAQRYLLGYAACHLFAKDEVVDGINVSTLPLYHGFGLLAPCLSLAVGKPCCFPFPTNVPTAASTVALIKDSSARSLMTVPSILEDLCLMPDEEALRVLASLDFVAVGGGPIKISVGERLAAMGVRLLNHYGATEIGAIAPIFCPQAGYDWHYLRLRKDMGLELTPVSGEDGQKGLHKLVGRPFGWDSTFEIADRLVLHPDRPESDFQVQGRTDDLVVLATGEKVMPQNLESALDRSPMVKAALVFGEGQFELGVIVQPAVPVRDGDVEQFITQLWPEILEANKLMDSHAQILFPEAIIVARDGHQLPRSDKGSLMRKEAYQSFKKEIEEAYRRVERGDMTQTQSSRAHFDLKNLHSSLQRLVQQCLGNAAPDSEADYGYDDDVFELGYDSLRALRLRRLIRVELNIEVEADFVYRNPTINAIAEAVRERMQADGEGDGDPTSSPRKLARTKGRAERMWGWVEQYSSIQTTATISQYHQDASDDASAPEQGAVIVLTGSTGSIGCHLLAYLSRHPKVHQIVCLDRPHNPQQPHNPDTSKDNHAPLRQKVAVHKHGMELTSHAWSKVTAIATDTSRPRLGLHTHAYNSICSKVTHVIHNAWPMDFKRPLESFKTQFQAVQNLLQLASDASLASSTATRFVFNSSIAAVARFPTITGNSGPIHEHYMDDAEATSTIGYAEAKWVCETIVQRVVVAHPGLLDASIVRIGQICGSEQSGVWNHTEHFPALLKSAQSLRRLPRIEGSLSWLPVDHAAHVLGDTVLHSDPLDPVYHIENPHRQNWSEILALLAVLLGLSSSELVPFDQWLECVADEGRTSVVQYPAQKLLDFFRGDFTSLATGEVILSTENTCNISPTLKGTGPVGKDLLEKYISHWQSIGFLNQVN